MSKETTVEAFDAADYLDSPEMIAAYLNAALAENDWPFLLEAVGIVARARGIASVADHAGSSSKSLYKSLAATGNPGMIPFFSLLNALDLRLTIVPMAKGTAAPADGDARLPVSTKTKLLKGAKRVVPMGTAASISGAKAKPKAPAVPSRRRSAVSAA